MNEEIIRKCDELVEKHQQATMSFLNERQKLINATKNAIISTKNTINVLGQTDNTHINNKLIAEQRQILTELESRI